MAVLQKLSSFHQFNRPKLCGPLTPLNIQIFTCSVKPRKHHPSFQVSSSLDYSKHHDYNRKLVQEFDPKITIEEAVTPPSSWYTDPSFYTHELNQVFFKGWQAVGYTEQIKEPRQYFTGRLGNVEYVICRDDGGKIHAFHNVCRHHASLLASGSGKSSCFVCPYHGWTYGLDGALLKATRITGIKNFKEMGLVPMRVAVWGPFILLNFDNGVLPEEESDFDLVGNEWLGNSSQILADGGVDSSLSFLCRREYTIECNWKVFCDNYLDGGYHVPYAHKGLASGLTLDSYSTTMLEKVSIQRCETGSADKDQEFDRLGSKALYAFVYPNFMINRYGPWMDTNLVLPQGPRKCLVIFDYFLDASLKFEASVPFCGFSQFLAFYKMYKEDRHRVLWFRCKEYYMINKERNQQQEEECTRCNSTSGGLGRGDESFIAQSLEDSETVQMEDIKLCEAVQRGLESPAYCSGRYAPQVEKAMHHFHCLLYENLSN